LLQDALQQAVFGIDASTVERELELRLQLLRSYVHKVKCGDYRRGGINEQDLEHLTFHNTQDGVYEMYKRYIPLSILLHRRLLAFRERMATQTPRAWVVGINAPPGSGKSTMVIVLVFLLSLQGVRAESVSTDDMYMSQAERKEAVPVIKTRLDPRSLDAERAASILHTMVHLAHGTQMEWPCFDKGEDERKRGCMKTGPFDLIILEGWRVGVAPGQLNNSKFDYTRLNEMIDYLMCINVPRHLARQWKLESTKRDFERTHEKDHICWTDANEEAFKENDRIWIGPFHQEHELPLAQAEGPADVVIHKGDRHRIYQIDAHEME
jgi:pantothenate kinase